MKNVLIGLLVAFFAFAGVMPDAEARRLGGGGSFGMQRQMTPPQAPRQPAASQQNLNRQQTQPPAAAAAKRSWLGPIAGLAAGLGLAALFSHLGLGEELASLLLIALLVVAAVMLFRMLARRAGAAQGANRMQYAGAPAGAGYGPAPSATPAPAAAPAGAAAQPDFDAEAFVRQAKIHFIRLQAANDEGNLDDLREFTSPEMFAELRMQIADRGASPQRTDVVELNAEVVEVSEEDGRYVVSVRFHGLIREQADAAPAAFDEVWHLTKDKQGGRGWVVAGIQQLA
ncbi:MAG TPA: Tim44-like domain-containing protein [Rhodocyclaceae bacterium]|nr:Tim44-like domain-containing protein [Rhodocyclaceae bacterium]